jgi:MFS family permease
VTVNGSAGIAGQIYGRVRHYKRLPMICLVGAIATLLVMGFAAKSLTATPVEVLLALLGLGFGPAAPLAMVALQNTVASHHLGAAVGTLSFMRNLCATMTVSIFGAIVLAGTSDSTVLVRGAAAAIPAEGFARIFFAAALSMAFALLALIMMEEKPLRTGAPAVAEAASPPGARNA